MSRSTVSIALLLALCWLGALAVPRTAARELPRPPALPVTAAQDQPAQPPTTPTEQPTGDSAGSGFFEGIGNIFAVLGIYVVTMFTMAIGTEILVDVLKGMLGKPLGLKSKPVARETLKSYEMFLPGKLDDLGISAAAKMRLDKQLANLNKLLEPAFKAEAVATHLRQKEFSAALAILGADEAGQVVLEKARAAAQEQLQMAVAQIDTKTSLGQAIKVALEKGDLLRKADREMDKLARRAATVTADDLYNALATLISGEVAEGVGAWTKAYLTSLQTESYETARNVYTFQLKPQIASLGLSAELEHEVEAQFDAFLENLKTYRGTDIYLESLNRMLEDLEAQRDMVTGLVGRFVQSFIDGAKRLLRRTPLQHPILAPRQYNPRIKDSSLAASKLFELDQYDKNEQRQRVSRLRLWSVIFGVVLAYALQIDSADLLRDLFPADASFLTITLIRQDGALFTLVQNFLRIPMHDLTAGVILSGLAASAGSTFWHEQLSRLQATKKGVEQAQAALQPLLEQARTPDSQS